VGVVAVGTAEEATEAAAAREARAVVVVATEAEEAPTVARTRTCPCWSANRRCRSGGTRGRACRSGGGSLWRR
jgi:hypothetical protein